MNLVTRKFLPSMHLLAAFEAVARTGSVTLAADELALTQGAVSRQILSLEEKVGAALFERRRKKLRLTKLGERYLEDIRNALDTIAGATLSLTTNPDGGVLRLAILPTFGTYWLAPKLPSFLALNPGVTIHFVTQMESFDIREGTFDAAIFFGDGVWEGTNALKLLDEMVIPACSPEFLRKHRFKHPRDLLRAPILNLSTRPDAWSNWLLRHQVTDPPPRSIEFDQFATLAQAAKHGAGIALLPWFLIEEQVRKGELVSAYGPPVSVAGKYYLVWPKSRANYPPVQSLVDWIRSQTNATG